MPAELLEKFKKKKKGAARPPEGPYASVMFDRRLLRLAKAVLADGFQDPDEAEAYTKEVAMLVREKKGKLGISSFRQNYKGTGSQRAVRQIWLRFKNGAVIDVWILPGGVQYGGVAAIHPSGERTVPNPTRRKTPDDARKTADLIADDLKEWMES
jgi:hypothetical protein